MESYHFCLLLLFCATGFAEESTPYLALNVTATATTNVSTGNDTQTQSPSSACDDIQCQAHEHCVLLSNGKPFCEPSSDTSPTCAGVQCRNNQLCVPSNGTAFCVSKRITTVILPTLCEPNPCLNGGECIAVQELLTSTCRCVEGFYGVICSYVIVELCTPNPCYNNGLCSVKNSQVSCDCGQGWKGELCDVADVCNPNLCLNAGTCNVINDLQMTCTCPVGWMGGFCDVQDLCNPNPCRNDGGCTQISDFQMECTCLTGWKGKFCQQKDVCHPNPCLNDGSCAEINELQFECNCPLGWKGLICEVLNDPCDPSPCLNDGACSPTIEFEPECTCPEQWTGEFCEVPSVCSPNPCKNKCECRPSCKHELGYMCVNGDGFIGKNCDIATPRVSCGPSEIVIDVASEFFEEFDSKIRNSFMYIAPNNEDSRAKGDERCKAIQIDTDMRLTLPLPFNDCGTTSQQTKSGTNYILFKNRLWINRDAEGGRIEMPVPVVDFECHYSRRYAVVTSLQPVLDQGTKVRRFGSFDIDYGLCKVASCPAEECPELFRVGENGRSAVYTVGQSIHFSLNVNTKQNQLFQSSLVSTLESMFLSCSPDPKQPGFVTFSADGCPTEAFFDVSVSSGMIDNPEKLCTSFQVPRVKVSRCTTFYIHAKVRLCDKGELMACEGSSALKCSPAADRRRRDLSADANTTSNAIIGPISILYGQQGAAVERLFLDDGYGSVITISNKPMMKSVNLVTTTNEPKPIDTWTIFYIVGAISLGLFSMAALLYLVMRLTTHHSRNTLKNKAEIPA